VSEKETVKTFSVLVEGQWVVLDAELAVPVASGVEFYVGDEKVAWFQDVTAWVLDKRNPPADGRHRDLDGLVDLIRRT